MTTRAALAGIAVALLASCGCDGRSVEARAAGAAGRHSPEAARGIAAIRRYDCGVCHDVPGVNGAHGLTAAPLDRFARRSFVGGVLPNTPDNLARWLLNPRGVDPLTAMPTVGMSEQEARDVAAYLYELR